MKLTIITINYNNKAGLKKTLDSVFYQTNREFEYVVIDGGSTDGSKELIESYSDSITYWISEPDKGIYNAMNKGFAISKGEYCLFLNSGDTLFDNGVIEFVLPRLSGDGIIIGKLLSSPTGEITEVMPPISMKRFYLGSVPHPSTFIHREWLEKYPYDENLKIVSDWKFFIQTLIFDNASYSMLDCVVSVFEGSGISATRKDLVEDERRKVLCMLFPERVILDYFQFINGKNYEDRTYDKFFVRLRSYKYSQLIYSIDVLILRLLSLFKKSASFSFNFPLRIK